MTPLLSARARVKIGENQLSRGGMALPKCNLVNSCVLRRVLYSIQAERASVCAVLKKYAYLWQLLPYVRMYLWPAGTMKKQILSKLAG